jgi:DNA polymerase elongation subunit (family B)
MESDLLLDIDYVTVDEKAYIRLFLRGEILYVKEFEPYFYVFGNGKAVEKQLGKFGMVERVNKKLLGKEKEVFRLTVSHPSDVPKIRGQRTCAAHPS